jgi:hypothetical protein
MRSSAILGILVLFALIGCSKPDANHGAVQGEVMLDSQPLTQGSILFRPMQGVEGTEVGGKIEAGHYALSGNAAPTVGWNRVDIHSVRKSGRMTPQPFPNHGEMEEMVEVVPSRFNTESMLKYEVKPGDNTADFEVTSK